MRALAVVLGARGTLAVYAQRRNGAKVILGQGLCYLGGREYAKSQMAEVSTPHLPLHQGQLALQCGVALADGDGPVDCTHQGTHAACSLL